jgi:hypothetical protein
MFYLFLRSSGYEFVAQVHRSWRHSNRGRRQECTAPGRVVAKAMKQYDPDAGWHKAEEAQVESAGKQSTR